MCLNTAPLTQKADGSRSVQLRSSPPHSYDGADCNEDASLTPMYRLVELAARTLETASPPEGHLARRYVPLLRGMCGIILSGDTQRAAIDIECIGPGTDTLPDHLHTHLGEDLWGMWQQAGLEPVGWPNALNEMSYMR